MNKEKLTLPICLVKEHISDFCVTLPLCVALTDTKLLPWYYENFINICSTNQNKALCFSNLGQRFMGLYNQIFNYYNLPSSIIENQDVCDIIINQLAKERNYCYIVLDEYYISCKEAFEEYHFIHQSLIYGYDLEDNTFLTIAFNKSGHLDYLKYGFNEVKNGFNCNNIKADSIIFFKPWVSKEEYKFSPVRFIIQLENYINSTPNYPEHFSAINISDTSRSYYGINAIKNTMALFSNEEIIDYNDFKNIHFLYEHKALMKKRLDYIKAKGYLNFCSVAINEYNNIVKEYTVLRMLALKTWQLTSIEKKVINRNIIKEKLSKLINKEVSCLVKIIKDIRFMSASQSIDLLDTEKVVIESISGTSEYRYAEKITFEWKDSKKIKTIVIPKYNYINIVTDNTEKYTLFSAYPLLETNYIYDINCNCKTIEMFIFSNIPVNNNVLPIFYQHDLTHGKRILFSSTFDNERHVDLSGNGYWRAAEQLNKYDGSDWLEVDFDVITKINTIIIGELDFSPRLTKYRILYSDNEQWKELLIHNFISGKEQIHKFDTISAYKLKIEFLECKMEQNGYYEPIINIFKVYFVD